MTTWTEATCNTATWTTATCDATTWTQTSCGDFTPLGVNFDGSTYLSGTSLTGVADSPFLLISLWVNFTLPFTTYGIAYFNEAVAFVQIDFTSDGTDAAVFFHAVGAGGEDFNASGIVSDAPVGWTNVLIAVDTGQSAGNKVLNVYFADAQASIFVLSDADAAFDMGFASVTALGAFGSNSSDNFIGDGAELWGGLGQYRDLDVEANRRLFVTADLQPVDPGTDGSTPTGTAPAIYLTRRTGDSASAFAGSLTVTGALTASGTDP